jgi:hypothetical protein
MANLDENLQKVYFPLFELKITKRIITLRSSQINIFIYKFSAGFPVQVLHVNFICIIALMRVFYESRSRTFHRMVKQTYIRNDKVSFYRIYSIIRLLCMMAICMIETI